MGIYSGTLDDSDDEDELGEPPEDLGVTCERVGLSREEDFVKVLVDPKLPSKSCLLYTSDAADDP